MERMFDIPFPIGTFVLDLIYLGIHYWHELIANLLCGDVCAHMPGIVFFVRGH